MENQEFDELVSTTRMREKTTNAYSNFMERRFGKMLHRLELIDDHVEILVIKMDIALHKMDNLEHKIDDLTFYVDESTRNLRKELRVLLDRQERIIAALKAVDTFA